MAEFASVRTPDQTPPWAQDQTDRNGYPNNEDITRSGIEFPIERRIDVLRAKCAVVRCTNIGRSGCILEGLLPMHARLRLAEPCQAAVGRQSAH